MIKVMLLMPSTYGWFFLLSYILYTMHLVEYDPISSYATYVYIYTSFMFVFSTVLFIPLYSNLNRKPSLGSYNVREPSYKILMLLHIIGFLGSILYVMEFSRYFGGPGAYMTILLNESHNARAALRDTTSIGIQVNYFGWIATGLSVWYILEKRKDWDKVLILSVLQFLSCLLYVSRMRPTWLFMILALMYLNYSMVRGDGKNIGFKVLGIGFFVIVFFISVGIWLGKIQSAEVSGGQGKAVFSGLESVYIYLTGGFVYFDKVLNSSSFVLTDYSLERVLYPLWKILAAFGIGAQPPSHIIEFLNIPFRFNVGTFLEPLYADGGIALVVIGVVLHTVGLNYVGYFLLKRKNSISVFMWSNICFMCALTPFVPKFNSFPIWLFLVFTMLFGGGYKVREN